MLIKCKDCESEYNAQDIAIPKSGIEFECSECGSKWTELPSALDKKEPLSEINFENEIVEPSILSGQKSHNFSDSESQDVSISTLAKQEILVQKGVESSDEKDDINVETYQNSERDFEWIPHKKENNKTNSSEKKSFEILTKVETRDLNNQNTETNGEIKENDQSSSSPSIEDEDLINPELIQRLKGVEKNQTTYQEPIQKKQRLFSKYKKFLYISLAFVSIFLLLTIGALWSEYIIQLFPFLEPTILLIEKILDISNFYIGKILGQSVF